VESGDPPTGKEASSEATEEKKDGGNPPTKAAFLEATGAEAPGKRRKEPSAGRDLAGEGPPAVNPPSHEWRYIFVGMEHMKGSEDDPPPSPTWTSPSLKGVKKKKLPLILPPFYRALLYCGQVMGEQLKWKEEQWPQVWCQNGIISLHFEQSVGDTLVLEGATQLREAVESLLKKGSPKKETWGVNLNYDDRTASTTSLGLREKKWQKGGAHKCGSLYSFYQNLIGGVVK